MYIIRRRLVYLVSSIGNNPIQFLVDWSDFFAVYSNMKFKGLILLLICISVAVLFVGFFVSSTEKEGFDTVPIKYANKEKTVVVYGYYQVDASNMAVIPYGYVIDPNNPAKIIPKTVDAKNALRLPKDTPAVPSDGQKMPDNFYLISDASLGVLPPNMSPNLTSLDFVSDLSYAPVVWRYSTGYISQTQYYKNQYKTTKHPSPKALAPGVYYVDPSHVFVSVLPEGMIADASNGFGKIVDPRYDKSVLSTFHSLSNRDISNNFNVKFHDSLDDIIAQNKGSDLSFGEVRVRDQNGDLVILPKIHTQEWTTYYQPGEFKFGAAPYVPNYEDSVYLSSISNTKKFAPSPYDYNSCASKACAVYQYVQNTLSPYCKNGGGR